ncbi:hypothetical protein AB0L41_25990 [Amycolatopsis mediterranei]|uniref:hypothetical protein n=1 Tax=Amycolatopsis mediterranei TaxID=33910 RepID=UPI003436335A
MAQAAGRSAGGRAATGPAYRDQVFAALDGARSPNLAVVGGRRPEPAGLRA